MAVSPDRDVFFVFGSVCRVLSGKVTIKEWRTTVQDIWQWSLQTTRELNGTAVDVPSYPQPAQTLPPPPPNGSPDPVLPPPAEKPVVLPHPAPIPTEQIVYLDDTQVERLIAHCRKQGMSQEGVVKYLKSHGIDTMSKVPLSQARSLWNNAKDSAQFV